MCFVCCDFVSCPTASLSLVTSKCKASNADKQPCKQTKLLQVNDNRVNKKSRKDGKGIREGKKDTRKGKGARYAPHTPLLFCFVLLIYSPKLAGKQVPKRLKRMQLQKFSSKSTTFFQCTLPTNCHRKTENKLLASGLS